MRKRAMYSQFYLSVCDAIDRISTNSNPKSGLLDDLTCACVRNIFQFCKISMRFVSKTFSFYFWEYLRLFVLVSTRICSGSIRFVSDIFNSIPFDAFSTGNESW